MNDQAPLSVIRDRLAIALDLPDLAEARRIAALVAPHFGVAKVGLELFSSAGPDAVKAIQAEGMDVFLDLKLHDIPNTVRRSAEALGRLGVRYTTLHAAGGRDMLTAGITGMNAGASQMGHPPPVPLAVTVLTSDNPDPELLNQRLRAVVEAGCPGIVCAAPDMPQIRAIAPSLFVVTPGIRPAGAEQQDQKRVATPDQAIAAGSSLLVVGRPITAATDPAAAAAQIAQTAAEGLSSTN
jgi:orotidine-5'-phosphate decarboxylase